MVKQIGFGCRPSFEHDCAECRFLGKFEGLDLYYCGAHCACIIGRFGDYGGDYYCREVSPDADTITYTVTDGMWFEEGVRRAAQVGLR